MRASGRRRTRGGRPQRRRSIGGRGGGRGCRWGPDGQGDEVDGGGEQRRGDGGGIKCEISRLLDNGDDDGEGGIASKERRNPIGIKCPVGALRNERLLFFVTNCHGWSETDSKVGIGTWFGSQCPRQGRYRVHGYVHVSKYHT